MQLMLCSKIVTLNAHDTVTIDGPDFIPGEAWRQVVGARRYWVSSFGRVWATKGGKRTKVGLREISNGRNGYPNLQIQFDDGIRTTQYVHDLIANAFICPKPEGLQVRHSDDVKSNSVLSNLTFGDRSDNLHDAVGNGIHFWAKRETCKWGHLYTSANTWTWTRPGADGHTKITRFCVACAEAGRELGTRKHPDFQAASDAAFRRIEGLPLITVIAPVDADLIRASLAPTPAELDAEYARSLDADLRAQSVA